MEEGTAGRDRVKTEQVQFFAQAAVVAPLGFFEEREVLTQFFFAGKGGAVNALQHLVALVPAPVGTSHARELEGRDAACRGDMGTTTEVDEFPLAVKRDHVVGDAFEDLDLVVLTHVAEQADRLLAGQFFTLDR